MAERFKAVRTLAPQPPPAGIFESKFTPELGASIAARVAAGESLRSICRNDPSMPTEKTVWNWTRQHPAFHFQMAEAKTSARTAAFEAKTERDASRRAAKAAKREARGWRPTPEWPDTYSAETAETICDRLENGASLQEVCRDPAMPSVATAYNWMRRHPEFLARYRLAREVQADVLLHRAAERAIWMGSYEKSMRRLEVAERVALRRCGRLWPRVYLGPASPKCVELVVRLRPDGSQEHVLAFGPEREPLPRRR